MKIPCGLCEEMVSISDCINMGGGIMVASKSEVAPNVRYGEDKIVCPACVLKYGCESALDQATPLMEILLKK